MLYLGALVGLALWVDGGWPPTNAAGVWFYSGSLAVLLSTAISEPFFTSPRVALANSAGLAIVVLTAGREQLFASQTTITTGRAVLVGIAGFVFFAALVAIATESAASRLNTWAFELSRMLGSGYFLYGLAFISSAYAAFAKSPPHLAGLLVAALGFTWQPAERILVLIPRITRKRGSDRSVQVVSVEDPATVIALAPPGVRRAVGDAFTLDDGSVGTVVDVTRTTERQQMRVVFDSASRLAPGMRLTNAPAAAPEHVVIGYVAPGTSMNQLQAAASSEVSATGIEEGRLLAASVRGFDVLYQVTDARVQEDTLVAGIRGRFRIDAQKLGVWRADRRSFDLVPWIPDPGAPVRLTVHEDAAFDRDGIGFVPGTSYAIQYRPTPAITHNTAILGILGSGKTTLARELVCRNVMSSAKVLILDITGQYAPFFDDLVPQQEAVERLERINAALQPFRQSHQQDDDGAFGSRGEFLRQVRADVAEFLDSADPIRIYNPIGFNVTTIDGYARGGRAELLREASTVEKTSLIAFALLNACAQLGETESGRVCLVIEEAHSLTPEPSEGLTKEDQRAVTVSARSVLQGRKYGYGCLLITQRTANVAKTILNQCHTVFAFRSYDATGIAFLSNYLGNAYSGLLSSLPKYHAIAFGAGISCDAPVIIRLNDPEEFRQGCWNDEAARIAVAQPPRTGADDGIPF